jgi:hypothetical protein
MATGGNCVHQHAATPAFIPHPNAVPHTAHVLAPGDNSAASGAPTAALPTRFSFTLPPVRPRYSSAKSSRRPGP